LGGKAGCAWILSRSPGLRAGSFLWQLHTPRLSRPTSGSPRLPSAGNPGTKRVSGKAAVLENMAGNRSISMAWKGTIVVSSDLMSAKRGNQASGTRGNGSYRYTVYFEPQTDGSFAVVFPAFPEIVTFGRTLDEARAMARDALRCHLEGLRKDGEAIPPETPPAGQPIREEVVVAL
jgi:predicted RNase H-like HicB family nuclease